MYPRTIISQARLKEVLSYDPLTGQFVWRVRLAPRGPVGAPAGVKNAGGYIVIRIDRVLYRAARLAFIYMTGACPDVVDHENRIRHDDRWVNLREATSSQNGQNTSTRTDNTSGHKGVTWDKSRGKWMAMITVDKRAINLGRFVALDEAVAARRAAELKHFGTFANL